MDKDHIIREIQRTAKDNGGVPLGRQRFFSATGIRDADWLGKHWARWGDALREAGFTANRFTSSYEKIELVERYIAFIRKLSALPTHADLKMEARADPTFPAHTTFDRLGSKSEIITLVLEHCRTSSGHDDVIAICEAYQPPARARGDDKPASVDDQIGFVYLIKAGRFYKIGRTNSAGRREREISLQLPERASQVHVIRTDDPIGIEAYWHQRFGAKRKNGEWFELAPADVIAFKRRKFM
jgi:hypothetical protein